MAVSRAADPAPGRGLDTRRTLKDVQQRMASADSDNDSADDDDDRAEMRQNDYSDAIDDDDDDDGDDDDVRGNDRQGSSQDEQDDSSPPPQPTEKRSYTSAVRSIAFGDLAEAQATLAPARVPDRRRQPATTPRGHTDEPSEKLQALRERLAELKQRKTTSSKKRKRTAEDNDPENIASAGSQDDSSDDGSDAEETKGRSHARSSKHAPAEQSSRFQVSRRRNITDVSGNPTHARDPRFVAATGHVDTNTIAKRYAFLGEYRDHELKELREVLKLTKDPDEKARLRLAVGRMENRARADRRREQQGEVLRQHRQQERERVKQGKKPFFLKRGQVRQQAVAEAAAALSGRERERLAKRRVQKAEQREKRQMPDLRRSAAAT